MYSTPSLLVVVSVITPVSTETYYEKFLKSFNFGFGFTAFFLYLITQNMSASSFTGLLGKFGGLAFGSIFLFGIIPFSIGKLWHFLVNL